MALRVWLPLNDTLENKGISNITVTNNGATVDSAGKIGNCYAFNGSTGYISLVGTQLFQIFTGGSQQFSIAMWVYHADATRAILFGDYSTSGAINFNIELSTGHGVRFYWNGSPDTYPSNATVAASGWTHVTLTYNGSLLQSYINGVAKGSWSGTLGAKNKTSGEFRLGRDNRSDSTAFNGKMNDFRVYDHCLSAAEVHEISQGLVLHYKLDDITNGIQDSSGYGHNGTIVNTPSLVTSQARYTSNIHFSANNQHIQLPAITYSNFGNSFTIAWWGKRSTHSNMMFWGFSDGNRLNGMYNGTLWNTGDGSNNPIYKPGTTTTITAPTATSWHHYVMVGNGTKSQLYVDGILYGEAKTYKGLTGTSIWINGWRNHTEYSSTDMDISDFRIYCTALSADDILSLYHTAAKVDNLGGLHTFEFQEKGPNKIYKTGITQGQEISEINGMSNLKYDPNVYIEPDGSAWVRIFHHNNPTSYKFASGDTFTTGVYKDANRWFNFDLCNYVDKWEFIAAVTRTNTDTLERYRWIQSVNPFTATFDQTKVANITRITTGYNTSPLGGLYHVSGSAWFAANNGTNNNWFGATGCWSAWNGGIPGWKSTSASDAITTGTIDIYLRIDNIETTMPPIAKSTKNNIWLSRQLIER